LIVARVYVAAVAVVDVAAVAVAVVAVFVFIARLSISVSASVGTFPISQRRTFVCVWASDSQALSALTFDSHVAHQPGPAPSAPSAPPAAPLLHDPTLRMRVCVWP